MYVKSPSKEKFKGISSSPAPGNRRKVSANNHFKSDGSAPNYGRRVNKTPTKRKLPVFTPWKVALASFLIGICGILYIGHVFDTQQALLDVNQLENEYNKAKRIYNQHRLTYDRLTGPKEIYQQARLSGFVNAGPADQIIIIQPEEK
ncbi:MAG: hypothetical protein WD513_07620 [Balneolaceae bacterium]